MVVSEKLNTLDYYGHPTGIRSITISSDDRLTCTVSKSVAKVWNVANRSCIQSLPLTAGKRSKKGESWYGLCAAFLPGNTHVAIGTREGHLLLIDISAGDIVFVEEGAHDGAIWALDVRRPSTSDSSVSVITGSADKLVKCWSIESQEEGDNDFLAGQPMFVHTRTLQMTDDVIAVKYSYSQDATKRLILVSTLDCTVKVFFEDSLKMLLSLYGHKLPALAVDCSDDDALCVTGGADKVIKIWGLDFGDTHRTMHGHGDSITDVRFVRRSHCFFSASKDGTIRYFDADRFEQILLLNGHCAEVNCLAVSRTGAFVLSGGMDRQVRVWERTSDIVFLEEERERELEQLFDKLNNRNEGDTTKILDRKRNEGNDEEDEAVKDNAPQSEAAVRKSVLSVSSGDRIMEALERADQELKDIATFRAANKGDENRAPNQLMLGLEPAHYVLWVLRTVKSAEMEQSLVVLSLRHIQRLMYYLIALLKSGLGVELCSRVAVSLIKAHQNQVRTQRFVASCCLR
jgi:U3 small nucleolar RNA-associated protein 12